MTLFTLGTISFNDDIEDADEIFWYGRVEGWDGMTNRVEEADLPAQHRSITLSNLYGARQMTVFGTAVCKDRAGYYIAKNKIITETNMFTAFADPPLILTHVEDVDKHMTVVRTGLQQICIDEMYLQFEMTLRADDPFKYDAAENPYF